MENQEQRQKDIYNLINTIAASNPAITSEQVTRARAMFRGDSRPLEEIEAELLAYSDDIAAQAKQSADILPHMKPEIKEEKPNKVSSLHLNPEEIQKRIEVLSKSGIDVDIIKEKTKIYHTDPDGLQRILSQMSETNLEELQRILGQTVENDSISAEQGNLPEDNGFEAGIAENLTDVMDSNNTDKVDKPSESQVEAGTQSTSIDELDQMFLYETPHPELSGSATLGDNLVGQKVFAKEYKSQASSDNNGENSGSSSTGNEGGFGNVASLLTIATLLSIMGIIISLVTMTLK